MTAKPFPHLTASGRIGSLELRNRMVVTAMGAGLAEPDGVWGERLRAYHEAQARGGVGLIISGAAGVAWPVGGAYEGQPAVSDDRFIPGLARIVDAVHAHGAKFAVQLHHGGPSAFMDLADDRPLWLPSPPEASQAGSLADILLPEELATFPARRATRPSVKVMTGDDIRLLVRQFGEAAGRAKAAGVDGVEIHGGHGYLIAAFLTRRMNRRTDGYGGPLENRARLLLEVIAAVRSAVGPDYPVWCKLDSREVGSPLGITVEDAIATARMAEAAGADAITVTSNSAPEDQGAAASNHTPHIPCVNLPAAARIKAAVSIPIIASGRVEPEEAEAAIAGGNLDFLSMGRKMLADPELPRKVVKGRAADIRPCVYCDTCISGIVVGLPVRCAANPRTGYELEADPPAAPASRRIVVVGGGPAGMEAARRLAQAGAKVVLLEAEDRLGGTLRLAAAAYAPNGRLLDWLRRQIEASGVEVRLGAPATPGAIRGLAPDAVVVATGPRWPMPAIPGADREGVLGGDDLRDLLLSGEERAPRGERVAIIGGDLVGLALAGVLAQRGRRSSASAFSSSAVGPCCTGWRPRAWICTPASPTSASRPARSSSRTLMARRGASPPIRSSW